MLVSKHARQQTELRRLLEEASDHVGSAGCVLLKSSFRAPASGFGFIGLIELTEPHSSNWLLQGSSFRLWVCRAYRADRATQLNLHLAALP